jgi:hypothetical protein
LVERLRCWIRRSAISNFYFAAIGVYPTEQVLNEIANLWPDLNEVDLQHLKVDIAKMLTGVLATPPEGARA